MLRLIFGKSGYGKTEYIRQKALELAQNDKNVIILVPDQMSFDTEKYMIFAKDSKAGYKAKVFHFGTFSEEIFKKYGGIQEKRIDESGTSLIMLLAIQACRDQFELYAKTNDNDLCNKMLQAITEFKNSGISAEDLLAYRNEFKGTLNRKIYEIGLIYQSFESILENTYIEPNDIETRAGDVLKEKSFFQNKTVLIDGFEGFDKSKMQIIASALKDADDVYVSLCLDDVYSEQTNSFFTPLRNTARTLIALSRELGRKVAPFVELETAHRFKSEDLIVLEENFMRQNPIIEKQKCENIKVFEAKDVYQEVEFVSATIKDMVRQGYKYGDFTIVCQNENKFTHLFENSLKRWEIPAFIALPRALDSSPVIRLILSAFRILEYGFKTEELLSLAKTGLCGLNPKEISELENYVFLWKINGVKWKDEFTQSPFGFDNREYSEQLAQIEEYRKKLIVPILKFKDDCQNETGVGISQAIYNLLVNFNSEEQILLNVNTFEELNLPHEAKAQTRAWEILMEILDKFAVIIGDANINFKKYSRLLSDLLSKEEIMDIPLRYDTVMFGKANKMKHSSKVVFVVGCIQDEFPPVPDETGVFSVVEKNQLLEKKFPLENTMQDQLLQERFYAYTAISMASEKVFASYHVSQDKEDLSSSEIISQIMDIFETEKIKNLPIEYFATMPEPLFTACAVKFKDDDDVSKTLNKLVEENEDFKGRFNALQRVAKNEKFAVNQETAQKLFSKTVISPSQIETYHHCKFQYFCKYGLGAKERKNAEIDVLQYGTLVHYLFEVVIKDEKYLEMDENQIKTEVVNLVQKYTEENLGGEDALSVFDLYRLKRMIETATTIIMRLMEEIRQSKFKPKHFELKLEQGGGFPPLKIKTSSGKEVVVGGIIDRVDIYEKGDQKYVRIVDYKTGVKEFKYGDVLNGLNLQMLVYLAALNENGYLPAGALYMPSAFPSVTAQSDMTDEKISSLKYEKMRMNGIILKEGEIISAMEEGIDGKYIPVKTYKNGNFTSEESLVTKFDLNELFKYSKRLIATMAENLINGNIEADPLMIDVNSCERCAFRPICGRENEEVEKLKIKKDEAIKIMKERSDKDENVDSEAI